MALINLYENHKPIRSTLRRRAYGNAVLHCAKHSQVQRNSSSSSPLKFLANEANFVLFTLALADFFRLVGLIGGSTSI